MSQITCNGKPFREDLQKPHTLHVLCACVCVCVCVCVKCILRRYPRPHPRYSGYHSSPSPGAPPPLQEPLPLLGPPHLSRAKRPSPAARCSSLLFSSLASVSMRFTISSSRSLILRRTPRDSGPPITAGRGWAQSGMARKPRGHLRPHGVWLGVAQAPAPLPSSQKEEGCMAKTITIL